MAMEEAVGILGGSMARVGLARATAVATLAGVTVWEMVKAMVMVLYGARALILSLEAWIVGEVFRPLAAIINARRALITPVITEDITA